MAKCDHSHSITLQTTDLLQRDAIQAVLEHGNLDQLQQIENPMIVRIVTIETRFCPACGRIYGEITAAA